MSDDRLLDVLAVDDEAPALDELTYLLDANPEIGTVVGVGDAAAALRALSERQFDAIFLDINMPGLSGLELASVLGNFAQPPAVVFVTAHEDKAVAAFDVGATDYLLKPLRRERLDEAVRRVSPAVRAEAPTESDDADEAVRRAWYVARDRYLTDTMTLACEVARVVPPDRAWVRAALDASF